MNSLKQSFGKNLRFTRKARDLTLVALGEMVDINQRQLIRLETGINFPSAETLEKLSYQLNVPVKQLFDFHNYYTISNKNKINVTFKAIKFDNTLKLLLLDKGKEALFIKYQNLSLSYDDCDTVFSSIAVKTKQSITVDFSEFGNCFRVVIYFADGTFKNVYYNTADELSNLIRKCTTTPNKKKLVELALKAEDCEYSRHKLMGILFQYDLK